ncbi:CDC42 small effector protein 2 isoform X1 [Rhinolophus sinicus]|uniref:CDC42 small effector protein 2 isoform X1 n=1 Tax=Rhinolophus sinicus TaxID=89399 RepID=UPI003D799DDA
MISGHLSPNCHNQKIIKPQAPHEPRLPGSVRGSTWSAGAAPPRCMGKGRGPSPPARGWGGAPARSHPALVAIFRRVLSRAGFSPLSVLRSRRRGLPSPRSRRARRGAEVRGRVHPRRGQGAGPARRWLLGGATLPPPPHPWLSERAPPLAPPAREPGRGGRGQEAASAPGSAAAGVGEAGAAEPAPRAAAAGAGGRDKGDDYLS